MNEYFTLTLPDIRKKISEEDIRKKYIRRRYQKKISEEKISDSLLSTETFEVHVQIDLLEEPRM